MSCRWSGSRSRPPDARSEGLKIIWGEGGDWLEGACFTLVERETTRKSRDCVLDCGIHHAIYLLLEEVVPVKSGGKKRTLFSGGALVHFEIDKPSGRCPVSPMGKLPASGVSQCKGGCAINATQPVT